MAVKFHSFNFGSQSSIGWIKDMDVFSKKLNMREHLLIMLWHVVCDSTEEIPSDQDSGDSVSYLY
ncbi:MAG: hypothetical protein MASP_01011 [Candidatus Methanolliviera sp. GoM_asphalt]|nr:MAG: hypothetical protein MASP_01011 [Candidatus Methanolliviera sp. GoM_asphalt]